MRTVRHPGPLSAERAVLVPCRVQPVELRLKAGLTINAAIAEAHGEPDFSGYLDLSGVDLSPLHYVIPAEAPDAAHAAWYSPRHELAAARIERAGAIVGIKDGLPFLHCHGLWDGRMGHLLPFDSIVASDCTVTGYKMEGAAFKVEDNPETNFQLFSPKPVRNSRKINGFSLVLRPNEPLFAKTEQLLAKNSVEKAQIFGIGSTVGCVFEDGRVASSIPTELLITDGRFENGRCTLDVATVTVDGSITHGRLNRDQTAVLVTFEIVIRTI